MNGIDMGIKKYLLIFLSLIVLIFIIQNTESVTVIFLTFEIKMPRAILLSATLIVGIVVGVMLPFGIKKNNN
ncbi:MAG: hypothetical protein CVV23_15905 [Ignavibacteriae bacterium HGW-Ignavibacteriae-2]|jgi:uncharacterized integral membrane protein|nr:MAG: hypothetical protein CVV23_15905 [Ignavibacteriae bacterium HGW-Ignavibacteriae-2]